MSSAMSENTVFRGFSSALAVVCFTLATGGTAQGDVITTSDRFLLLGPALSFYDAIFRYTTTEDDGTIIQDKCEDPAGLFDCNPVIRETIANTDGEIPNPFVYVTLRGFTRSTAATLVSTGSLEVVGSTYISQPIDTFSLDIELIAPRDPARTNLLRVTGTAQHSLDRVVGGTTATLSASTELGDIVNFESDYFDFSQTTVRSFVYRLNNIQEPAGTANQRLTSFTGTFAEASFFANPLPRVTAVPEPSSGAALLLISGLVLSWGVRRRRIAA